ncbi:hypothetical protein L596_009538 [Steinernema carpocapsae]|uniref:PIF1/LRR1 pleckstrin homology domain-containing protein n=1 Tax=Steinernema carpocapsae TaxID=34508 RepID=A0A4U5PFU3_STECR|nr:hypothetical protein L596_009538 [Steinernema carpocapsae]
MHVTCTVSIQPLSQGRSKKPDRPYKATVTLVQRRNPDNSQVYSLIIKDDKKKTVPPLKICQETIEDLKTALVQQGTASIVFKTNRCLFMKKADPKQLHLLMESVRDVLTGRTDKPKAAVPPSFMKAGANPVRPVNLRITDRSQYPLKGFPEGLRELVIEPINLRKVDRRWFRWVTLRKLEIVRNPLLQDLEFHRNISMMSRLKNLQELILTDMDIQGFTFEFWEGLPKNLVHLDLRRNSLKSVPANVSRLSRLQKLLIDDNHITRISDEIGLMPQLQSLTCSNNQISYVPAIFQFSRLQTLDLSNNLLISTSPAPEPVRKTGVGSLFQLSMAALRGARYDPSDLLVPKEVVRQKYSVKYCFGCYRFVPGDSTTKLYKKIPVSKFRIESVSTGGMLANPDVLVCENYCLSCASKRML